MLARSIQGPYATRALLRAWWTWRMHVQHAGAAEAVAVARHRRAERASMIMLNEKMEQALNTGESGEKQGKWIVYGPNQIVQQTLEYKENRLHRIDGQKLKRKGMKSLEANDLP